jgi:hypothetical protein
MPTTPKLILPYPNPTDPADVPADIQRLAQKVDDQAGVASGLALLDATGKLPAAYGGAANGLATLDATGKVPAGQLPSSGGGGGLTKIFDVVVGRGNSGDPAAPAASIDSQAILTALGIAGGAIPQTYAALRLMLVARGDTGGTSTTLLLQCNGDVTIANYFSQRLRGNGGTAGATEVLGLVAGAQLGAIATSGAPAGAAGMTTVEIDNYTGTTFQKLIQALGFNRETAASAGMTMDVWGNAWLNVAALTRLLVKPSAGNFVAGTRATLLGL